MRVTHIPIEEVLHVIREMLICLDHGSHANPPLVQTLLVKSQLNLNLNLSPTDVNSKLRHPAFGAILTALPGLLTDIKLSTPCLQTILEMPAATTLLSRLLGNLFIFLTKIYTLTNSIAGLVAYRNKIIQGIMKQTANLSIQLEQQASEERINLNQTTLPNSKELNNRIHCSENIIERYTQLTKHVTDAIEIATFILKLHDFFEKNKIKVHIKTDHCTTMIDALEKLSDSLQGIESAATLKTKLENVSSALRRVPWQKTTPTTTQTQPGHTNLRYNFHNPKLVIQAQLVDGTCVATSAATSAKKRKNNDSHSPQGDSPLCSGAGSKKQKASKNRHRFTCPSQSDGSDESSAAADTSANIKRKGGITGTASSTTNKKTKKKTTLLPDQKNVRPQLGKKRSTHSHQPTSHSPSNGIDASSAAADTPTTSLDILSSFC